MKKIVFVSFLAAVVLALSNCGPSKKVAAAPVKSTFATNLEPVIVANCTPCHFPSKGGNKKPYDNYANVKADIDEMIRRIDLNPTDRGFMPFKRAKLSDSTINVFKQWRADGMMEK
jgi:hypothetical protein